MNFFSNFSLQIIVYVVAAAQLTVAGSVFAFLKGEKAPVYSRSLATLFFLIAIVLFDMALEKTMVYLHYPQFGNIGKMFATALPGLVYLYARRSYMEQFRLHWYDAFHCLPVLLKGGAALFFYHLQPRDVQIAYWEGGWQTHPINWPWLSTLVILIYVVQIILLMRLVHRHHKSLQQVRSNTLESSYRLLKVFAGAYCIQLLLNISRAYLVHIQAFEAMQVVTTVMGLWIYVVVTLLIIDLILGSDRRNTLSDEEAEISGFAPAQQNEHRLPEQDNEHWTQLSDQLDQFMREHQPYLDPNLTLVQVARKLGVPGRELSSFINNRLGCNFSDYIANWRIGKAKDLLQDANCGMSITDVLYASGFNSKSVFNTHFKKQTGMTPSQWRQLSLMQAAS
ncbi:AraC family transcriptional regulator [Reinekea sp. G2M2-21]|uniref:helix-turn-helix domain-containing protein n=1 Tax=Reinekea sp. G2M2-21 TaxID=2788942 RepID=UPI0018AB25F0|nr:response regulator transcription factor [Reinekea sp. G2M2-21]